ncbi:MAG: DUF4831 family protein [Muribaculaceae bacterium]|nr:DUF4831 family protein [Muribaculaceae bacterium]
MNLKAITAAVITAAFFTHGTAAQTSQRFDAGKASEYGLVYSLPLTAIDIYIEAETSVRTPGEFQNYAKRHLGITDAITSASHSAAIRSVTIVPRGVADPDQRWLAQFKAGSTPFMILNADGIPLAINTETIPEQIAPAIPAPSPAAPSPLETPEARQAVTQDMARSSSSAKRAELAAARIFELREMRSDILSGQADNMPTDGKAMKLVLDNLQAQEEALTAMFAGTTATATVVEKYSYLPDSTDASGVVIARLSAVEGLIDADNLAGVPVTLDIRILEQGELPVNDKGETKTFPKGGVAYRIPGTALVTISYEGRTVASSEVALAQLGAVFGLNPALFTDKKEPSKVIFDPATGGIVTLGPAN